MKIKLLALIFMISSLFLIRPALAAKIPNYSFGVYWDEECTNPVTLLPWGDLTAGEWKSLHIYVRNEGNIHSLQFSFWTDEWNPPEAQNYVEMYVSWASGAYGEYISRPTDSGWEPDSVIVDVGEVRDMWIDCWVSPNGIREGLRSFSHFFYGHVMIGADMDEDEDVDAYDLGLFADDYGKSATPFQKEDVTRDGIIDINDLFELARYDWGVSYQHPPYIVQDVNQDGVIDLEDQDMINAKFGQSVWCGYYKADINHDGTVDPIDLGIFADDYGLGT